jgi:adenylate kinase family enzyme
VRRIAIIGPGGAGKSWLATRLGERLGIEVIHLDRHFWKPGWVETGREEWRRMQIELLDSREAWIADGHYGGTIEVRLERADTVIFLDPHPVLAIARVLKRELGSRREGMPAERSQLNRGFLEFLHWIWSFRRRRRPAVLEGLKSFPGDVYLLTSREDVTRFLAAIPPARDASGVPDADGPGNGEPPSRVPPLRRHS